METLIFELSEKEFNRYLKESNGYLNRLKAKKNPKHLRELVEKISNSSYDTIHQAHLNYQNCKKLSKLIENFIH